MALPRSTFYNAPAKLTADAEILTTFASICNKYEMIRNDSDPLGRTALNLRIPLKMT